MAEHLVEVECGRLLARRELDEGLDLLGYEPLHLIQQVGVDRQASLVAVATEATALRSPREPRGPAESGRALALGLAQAARSFCRRKPECR